MPVIRFLLDQSLQQCTLYSGLLPFVCACHANLMPMDQHLVAEGMADSLEVC